MKIYRISITVLLAIILIIGLSACSKNHGDKNPIISESISDSPVISDGSSEINTGNREVLGVYDVVIDPVSKIIKITPFRDRTAGYHLPLSNYFPNVLKIVNYGWTPKFWADIKISHPYPGSGIDGFDPRVIAIMPANPGVSFNYPVFNAIGNNSVVLEFDGYTKLFDNVGGSIPGNTNPFKAYFKSQPNRVWSSTGVTSETQRWNMDIHGFGGPFVFKLVVDVSTNYPNPPQPIIDNAPEPVAITTYIGDGLIDEGGSAQVDVTFLDWQGQTDIKCKVECPDLFSGAVQLLYSHAGSNPNEYVFTGTISNSLFAPAGGYHMLVAAWDIPTDIHIFNEVDVQVGGAPTNLVDVTPPGLYFRAVDIDIDGSCAYVAGYETGFVIFDISNPLNPVWVKTIETPRNANGVYILNGYAYIAEDNLLQIIDIDPPETAYEVKEVYIPGRSENVYVSGGYAYVADRDAGLQIIDVDPVADAHSVKTVYTPDWANDVEVKDGYAYVAADEAGLLVIDIDPIGSASIINTIDTPSYASDVKIQNNYAYIADCYSGIQIIDIGIPGSEYIAGSMDTPGRAYDIDIANGYAYIADCDDGLVVINISDPHTPALVNIINSTDYAIGVSVSGNYAYIADNWDGIKVIDIGVPMSEFIAATACPLFWCSNFNSDGYAYSIDESLGFHIIDADPPETTKIVKTILMQPTGDWDVTNGYAYVLDTSGDLKIIDVDPPQSAGIIKSVGIAGDVYGVSVTGGLACVASDGELHVIDVDPPELAYIVKSVSTAGGSSKVHTSNGYAFVLSYSADQLQIIDIDPPDSAHLINTINITPGVSIYKTEYRNGYAYLCHSDGAYAYLQIIDIDPPESAHTVNDVRIAYENREMFVTDDYAYVTCEYSGLVIVDINPPETAYVVKTVGTPEGAEDVFVYGGFAYVADRSAGIQIMDINPPQSAHIETFIIPDPGEAWIIAYNNGYAYVTYNNMRIIKLW